MSFTINENTIGIKGASGEAWITRRTDGVIRDVICHMKIPGHWIFKTESKMDNDPLLSLLGGFDAMSPVGKNGAISLDYEFQSPRAITYWKWRTEEIGWYGQSTDMGALQEEFKEMGKFLSSAEAKAQFDSLYEGRAQEPEEEPHGAWWEASGMVAYPMPAPAGAGAGSLSDEERREKNRKAKERAKKRKAAAKAAAKAGPVPVGMVYEA